MELSTAAQRISHYLNTIGVSENEFTRRTQWSQGLLGKAVKRGSAIGSDKIDQVLRHFPEINAHWIITGEGPMTSTVDKQEHSAPASNDGNIVVLNSKAAAGLYKHHGQQEYLRGHSRMTLPGQQFMGDGLLAIQVDGDSMDPTVIDGDWLVVRQLRQPKEEVQPGHLYVVVTEGGAMAKRLYIDIAGRRLVCESDNPDHKPIYITEKAPVVYGVLALLRERPGDQRHSFNARLIRVEQNLSALKKIP